METEIKLSPVTPSQASKVFGDELIAPFTGQPRRFDMESVYYSDPSNRLGELKAVLRLRLENGEGVCCLKISSGTAGDAQVRQEYEVKAGDIDAGAALLAEIDGIPDEIKAILTGGGFTPVCGCSFTRTEADFERDGLSFVLSFDVGEYYKGGARAPLGEMELELKSGSPDELTVLCRALCEKHGMTVCSSSKYHTAMSLDNTHEN